MYASVLEIRWINRKSALVLAPTLATLVYIQFIGSESHAYMKAEGIHEKHRMAHRKQRKTKNTKTEITYERLQVLAVVLTLMQIKVFWDITSCTMTVPKFQEMTLKMKARLLNSVTTYQSTWHHNLANMNIYKSYLLCRLSTFRKDMQLTILGKSSNYTSWPVRTKWKLKIINTETIHVIGRNSKGSISSF
jgi:hypothetical protein